MANQTESRVYWDADVFVAYFNKEPARIATLDALLGEVEKSNGKRKILTSTITKVEVSFILSEKNKKKLNDDTEAILDGFWEDASVFEMIEFHDDIAKTARRLIRYGIAQGWTLKPLDAIHLASAQWLNVNELHTYNQKDFAKFRSFIGCDICDPYVTQPPLPLTP